MAIAGVDCTAHADICSKYEVKGYPTIKLFTRGQREPNDYQGPRTTEAIVSYLKEQASKQEL